MNTYFKNVQTLDGLRSNTSPETALCNCSYSILSETISLIRSAL